MEDEDNKFVLSKGWGGAVGRGMGLARQACEGVPQLHAAKLQRIFIQMLCCFVRRFSQMLTGSTNPNQLTFFCGVLY